MKKIAKEHLSYNVRTNDVGRCKINLPNNFNFEWDSLTILDTLIDDPALNNNFKPASKYLNRK